MARDTEMVGKMDPYVVFYVGDNSCKTEVHKDGGKAPVWKQNLKV